MFLSFLLLALIARSSALCYFVNNTLAEDNIPCDNGKDGFSACCGRGFACLSNNICMLTDKVVNPKGQSSFVRGSCTDPSWNSPKCPTFCISEANGDNVEGGNGIGFCNYNGDYTWFCINAATINNTDAENCASHSIALPTKAPSIITTIGYGAIASSLSTVSRKSSQPSSKSIRTSSSNSSNRSSSTASGSSSLGAASTSDPAGETTSPIPPPQSKTSGLAIGLGVGLGIGLGLIAAVVLAYLIYQHRRARTESAREMQKSPEPPHYSEQHKYVSNAQPALSELDTVGERQELSTGSPTQR